MEIRSAIRADIPRLVMLGEEFAHASAPVHGFSVSRERIIEFANQVVENPGCVVLVLVEDGEVQGFLAGVLQRIFFSEDVALQELAWYVKPGYKGLRLLLSFEERARDLGVTRMIVGNKPQFCDFKRLYERRGFTLLENQYAKTLGPYKE